MYKRAVCTIVTKNYLAYARTLAESVKTHNSNISVYVLLADRVDGYFNPSEENFHLIELDDLPEKNQIIEKMCFYYTPFELCCALRGALHEYMMRCTDIEQWLFLDSDVLVYDSLDYIFKEFEDASILLSPHNVRADKLSKTNNFEINFLIGGVFNAGFLGLRRDNTAASFISWFKERLTWFSFDNIAIGDSLSIFVDQLWLNLVPLYFDTKILSSPRVNLGHWNLWGRKLSVCPNGKIVVDGQSILFIHFSGWDINCPHKVSSHNPHYNHTLYKEWSILGDFYRAKLLSHGYEITKNYPYAFAKFISGEVIPRKARRFYFQELFSGINVQRSPFGRANIYLEKPYPGDTSVFYLKEEISLLKAELNSVKKGVFPWYRVYEKYKDNFACFWVKFRALIARIMRHV
jgi:hypothetical protein